MILDFFRTAEPSGVRVTSRMSIFCTHPLGLELFIVNGCLASSLPPYEVQCITALL